MRPRGLENSVYIATDFVRKEEARELAQLLEAEAGFCLNARWISSQETPKPEGMGGELVEDEAEFARTVATQDLEDIWRSNVFIQLTNGEKKRGGNHVELGYAIAQKLAGRSMTIVTVGPRENAFHYHPTVTTLADKEALLDWARGFAEGARI